MLKLKQIEIILEFILWNSRFFTIIPVVFGLLSVLKCFLLGTVEIYHGIQENIFFHDEVFDSKESTEVVSNIMGGIDLYLIGIVLLIFSLGIYELFISQIDFRLKSEARHVLVTTSLEELKGKILQVIIVALIVNLFKQMLNIEIKSSVDIIYVSTSILLVALSSYLMYSQNHLNKKNQNTDSALTLPEP